MTVTDSYKTEIQALTKSISEEAEAVRRYRERARTAKSLTSRRLWLHVLAEEKAHEREFRNRLAEVKRLAAR